MNDFNPEIAPAVRTLISFGYSTEKKWKANADLINEKIDHIVSNFQLLSAENFKSLRPKIQEKILDKLLDKPDSSVTPLIDYLEDEACSRLVNEGKHVDKLAVYFLQLNEDETVSLHSNHLNQDKIAYYLESLDPETKRVIKQIDLSNCLNLTNLDFIKEIFESVEKIKLSNNSFLENVEGLEGKAHLSEVELDRCSSLISIAPLGGLPIKRLNASRCAKLTTISETISSLPNLASIDLSVCLGIDAEGWRNVGWPSSIKEVNVSHIPQFGKEALDEIKSKNPDVVVDSSNTSVSDGPTPPNSSTQQVYIRV